MAAWRATDGLQIGPRTCHAFKQTVFFVVVLVLVDQPIYTTHKTVALHPMTSSIQKAEHTVCPRLIMTLFVHRATYRTLESNKTILL